MAKFIPNNPFTQAILNAGTDGLTQDVTDAVSYVSKAYRALIIVDRNARGFQKAPVSGGPLAYHHELTPSQGGNPTKDHATDIKPLIKDPTAYKSEQTKDPNLKDHRQDIGRSQGEKGIDPNSYRFEEANKRVARTFQKDYISIIDLDFNEEGDFARNYNYLNLPFTPKGLDYNVSSSFVAIATMGRNNPHYHFTGSEDTLEFTIDWHSYKDHREDVLFYCRWMESLSKGDGYRKAPHRIKLAWGQDSVMFQDDVWIVVNASYKMEQFVDSYNDTGDRSNFTRVGMLPQQAYQKITLKRVSQFNRTTEDIMGAYNFMQTANNNGFR